MRLAVTSFVFCVAALLALGLVILYSASMTQVGAHYLVRQLVACALGLIVCVVAASLDYRLLKRYAWLLFIMAVVMLGLVFVPPFGIRSHGAARWLGFGRTPFFQPSEVAKVILIITLAWYADRYERQMPKLLRGIVIPGLFIGLILGLIFKEPDVGNMLLLATVSGLMLLTVGIRLRYFLPPVLAGALAVGLFIYHNPMRSSRVYSWLHVEETRQNKGLQAHEAMVALGSGGLTGKGLGESRQKLGFLPEHHTDFIFSIIGEELGLISTLLVVAAYVLLVVCGVQISWNAPDTFGLLLGTGLSFLIGLQAFINIGVVTSALPNKGLPLPFISFGGSNLVVMLACAGVILSIARLGRAPETVARPVDDGDFQDSNPFKARRRAERGAS